MSTTIALLVTIAACTVCGWIAGRYFQQWLDQREERRMHQMRGDAQASLRRMSLGQFGGLN